MTRWVDAVYYGYLTWCVGWISLLLWASAPC
jgi:hypothetical protein